MHYKNGRPVSIGDWVVGKTHNSENKVMLGIVLEMMPKQGPCNVRMCVLPDHMKFVDIDREEPGILVHKKCGMLQIGGREDYADAKELIHVLDGFRMVDAVHRGGLWDSPYFTHTLG